LTPEEHDKFRITAAILSRDASHSVLAGLFLAIVAVSNFASMNIALWPIGECELVSVRWTDWFGGCNSLL